MKKAKLNDLAELTSERMEKEGWVTRTKTKADGRKVYITLTDKALELEDQIKARVTGCFGSVDMSSD